MTDTDPRAGYIAGLRQLADALEQHPEVPLPYDGTESRITFMFFEANPRERMAAARAALGGTWEKDADDNYFDLNAALGGGLLVQLTAHRDAVCERVVTGVETVTTHVPDPEALARVPQIETTREVETVEWVCAPVLA